MTFKIGESVELNVGGLVHLGTIASFVGDSEGSLMYHVTYKKQDGEEATCERHANKLKRAGNLKE